MSVPPFESVPVGRAFQNALQTWIVYG